VATTNASWIAITSPTSGNGTATLNLVIAANTGGQRDGIVTVADQVLTIRQSAVCRYDLSPTGQTIAAAGGAGGVAVSTGAGCSWTAASNAAWITVTSGAAGNGPGSVSFAVAPNTGGSRTGALIIGDATFTITQAGAAGCTYSVTPTTQTIAASGGVAPAIAVSTAGTACAWTATSNVPWVTVLSGASGVGNGAVIYEVAANTGSSRTATLTIAGQVVTVTQGALIASGRVRFGTPANLGHGVGEN
jgi:hypothetical protein